MLKNWKTSLGGILGGLSLLLAQASLLFDGSAQTMPDLSLVLAALGMLGIGVAARDA